MQVEALHSLTSSSTRAVEVHSTATAKQPSVSAHVTSASTPSATVSTSVKSAASSSAASSTKSAAASSASSSTSSTSGVALEDSLVAFYSTSFGGKKYPASVESGGGQYTAFVTALPGATAVGSSIQSAEAALGPVIDILA